MEQTQARRLLYDCRRSRTAIDRVTVRIVTIKVHVLDPLLAKPYAKLASKVVSNPADAPTPRRSGRPRDDVAGATVLRAAYEMLSEGGIAALTIEGVARRAGVGRPMIYRRWPNKRALAVACFRATVLPTVNVARTDDVVADLRSFIVRSVAAMSGPAGPIMASILAEAQRDEATLLAFKEHYIDGREAELAALIADGQKDGLFNTTLNVDVAVKMILGAILQSLTFEKRFARGFVPAYIDLVLRALGTPKLLRLLKTAAQR